MRQALADRGVAPCQVQRSLAAFAPHGLGELHEPLGRVGPPIEDHVFDVLEQILWNVFVDDQLAGVDDPHVEARFDGVEEKRRVDGLANHVVSAEGKRQIADPAADM
jgi:hypothetical protein